MIRWVKAIEGSTDSRRAHTCHAVGGQMIVLGGYPPGVNVNVTAPCDKYLIQVFDLNKMSVRLKTLYMKYWTKSNDK